MKNDLLRDISSDLGLNVPFVKGHKTPIKNCWHFSTDGSETEALYLDETDFKAGMNRIFLILVSFNVVILAFCLMDTHIHFVLYGKLDECKRFINEYIRRTSQYISERYGEKSKLAGTPVSFQKIEDDSYLKTVICYVIKNAPVGGLQFSTYDYPWSSGALYFRKCGYWTTPSWDSSKKSSESFSIRELRDMLHTRNVPSNHFDIIDGIVFPGDYVAIDIVKMIFKTHKSFNYFLCKSKEEEVESRGGAISSLTIPIQEMRQHKNEVCEEMFKVRSIRSLNTTQRIILARSLKSKYNSSVKQIAKMCGLVYSEVKEMI